MHQIDPSAFDFLLPAEIALAAAVEFVEGHFADETNHIRSAPPNEFYCAAHPHLFLAIFQFSHVHRGSVHQIDKVQSVFWNELFFVNALE